VLGSELRLGFGIPVIFSYLDVRHLAVLRFVVCYTIIKDWLTVVGRGGGQLTQTIFLHQLLTGSSGALPQ
jgi:hypothetical protein